MGQPRVHAAVLERVQAMRSVGAPAALPASFRVDGTTGDSCVDGLRPDVSCLARLRRLHRWRGLLYSAFVGWTLCLVALLIVGPAFTATGVSPAWGFLGIGYFLSALQLVMPGFVAGSIETLLSLPFYTLALTTLLAGLVIARGRLVGPIRELRRAAWSEDFRTVLFERRGWKTESGGPDGTSPGRQYEESTLVPRLVAVAVAVLLVAWLVSWYSVGAPFPPRFIADPVVVEYGPMPSEFTVGFATSNPGLAVGPVLLRGERYSVSVVVDEDWLD